MVRSRMKLLLPFLIGAFVAGGCGEGEDPVEPDNSPPDLTGTYTLRSLSSILTAGETLIPPAVSGTFTLEQLSVVGTEASGTMSVEVVIPDGEGGMQPISDEGTFTVRSDGTWEQAGQLLQGKGTYELMGNTLTVVVTEPAFSVSTTVWQRQ